MNYEIIQEVRNKNSLFPMSNEEYDKYIKSRFKNMLNCVQHLDLPNDINLESIKKIIGDLINEQFTSSSSTTSSLLSTQETINTELCIVLHSTTDYSFDIDKYSKVHIITTKDYLTTGLINRIVNANIYVREYIDDNVVVDILSKIGTKDPILLVKNNLDMINQVDNEWINSCNKINKHNNSIRQFVTDKKLYGYNDNHKGLIEHTHEDIKYSLHRYIKRSEQIRLNINYPNVHDTSFVLTDGLYFPEVFIKDINTTRSNFVNNNLLSAVVSKRKRLEYVVASCNDNYDYCKFIPNQIEVWNKFGVKFLCVLAAEKIPSFLEPYKNNIVLWDKSLYLNSVYLSQVLRIFYPALIDTENYVMITDLDMLPVNLEYYTEYINNNNCDDKFVYLRSINREGKEIFMCYNIARPKVWSKIFDIKNEDDIKNIILKLAPVSSSIKPGDPDWFIDQHYMYDKLVDHPDFIELGLPVRRLEPSYLYTFDLDFSQFDDAHFHRGQFVQERLHKFMDYIRSL